MLLNNLLFGEIPKIGEKAPDFLLNDQDNTIHRLVDYTGKRLIIYFFPKANTPGWIKQACGLRDESENFEKYNIAILGVSYDTKSVLKSFKENHKLNFNLLSDSEKIMGKDYGVNRFNLFPSRKTFLIDEDGILVHVLNSVNLNTHPKDILDFFKQ